MSGHEQLLEIAREAAELAAAELRSRVGKVSVLRAKSSPTDPVTEADEAAEGAVRKMLALKRPADAIVGEEGGEATGTSGYRWIIDPFTRHGVHSPSPSDPLAGVLLATGFHYEADVRAQQAQVFANLIPRLRDIRRGGSAALDLCWAAIGRVDAYTELGVREWDVAAGGLVCLCSELEVAVVPAGSGRPQGIIAAQPEVLEALASAWGMGAGLAWPQARIA